MADTPITLETAGLHSWDDLYALDPVDGVRRMSEKNVPVHAGDAFLAVLVMRSIADLVAATKRLDDGTKALVRLTIALTVVSVLALVVAVVALTHAN